VRLLLLLGALIVALPVGALIVWSILADASMLVGAGGWWMLLAYLVVPTLIGISWLLSD